MLLMSVYCRRALCTQPQLQLYTAGACACSHWAGDRVTGAANDAQGHRGDGCAGEPSRRMVLQEMHSLGAQADARTKCDTSHSAAKMTAGAGVEAH